MDTDVNTEIAGLRDHDWRMLVAGRLTEARRRYVDESPAADEAIGHVPDGDEDDVGRAVDAAQGAHQEWRRVPARQRGALVARMADVLSEHLDELAWLDTLDCGAPIAEMRQDGARAMESLRLLAGLAIELAGRTIPATSEHLHYTVREPYGVAARIIPFNHPFMFAAAKIAAPLVAGNSVVLKSAEATPLSALRMVSCWPTSCRLGCCRSSSGTVRRCHVRSFAIRRCHVSVSPGAMPSGDRCNGRPPRPASRK